MYFQFVNHMYWNHITVSNKEIRWHPGSHAGHSHCHCKFEKNDKFGMFNIRRLKGKFFFSRLWQDWKLLWDFELYKRSKMTLYIQIVHCAWNVFDFYLLVKINLAKLWHIITQEMFYVIKTLNKSFYVSKTEWGLGSIKYNYSTLSKWCGGVSRHWGPVLLGIGHAQH